MNTSARWTAILTTAFCTACADVGNDDDGSNADSLTETESALTASSWSCTVEKSDTTYSAEALITDGRLAVRLDGMPGRNKNNVALSARYPDYSVVKQNTIPDNTPSQQWLDIPVFLQKGAEIAIGVRFDLEGLDRECLLDIKL